MCLHWCLNVCTHTTSWSGVSRVAGYHMQDLFSLPLLFPYKFYTESLSPLPAVYRLSRQIAPLTFTTTSQRKVLSIRLHLAVLWVNDWKWRTWKSVGINLIRPWPSICGSPTVSQTVQEDVLWLRQSVRSKPEKHLTKAAIAYLDVAIKHCCVLTRQQPA